MEAAKPIRAPKTVAKGAVMLEAKPGISGIKPATLLISLIVSSGLWVMFGYAFLTVWRIFTG